LTKREYIALNNLFILSCKLKILVMHCVLLLVSSFDFFLLYLKNNSIFFLRN
jgi:hypothetical protein